MKKNRELKKKTKNYMLHDKQIKYTHTYYFIKSIWKKSKYINTQFEIYEVREPTVRMRHPLEHNYVALRVCHRLRFT